MSGEKSLLEKLSEEVRKIGYLISGDPFDQGDTGMKGTLLDNKKELEDFDVTEFKANTAFRKRKESEMSRVMVGVVITLVNILVTSAVTVIIMNKMGTP